MMTILLVVYYLLASSFGLILLKMFMTDTGLSVIMANKWLLLDWRLLLGGFLYASSFISWIFILAKLQLTYIYPIIVGLGYVMIILLSVIVLGESPNLYRFIGIALILVGVVIVSIKGQ